MRSEAKKKVLLVTAGTVEMGGVQKFILDWVNHAPSAAYDFTWYVAGTVDDTAFLEAFKNAGIRIIIGNKKLENGLLKKGWYFLTVADNFRCVLKREKYDIVHINTGTIVFAAIASCLAKKARIPKVIVHAHSAPCRKGLIQIVYTLSRLFIRHYADVVAGCSKKAILFMRGNLDQAVVVPNCIDTRRFAFSVEARGAVRETYALGDQFVMGEVARLAPEKNLKFLIDVFQHVHKKDSSARLMLVGGGPEEAVLKQYVLDVGLSNEVIFTGLTAEPEKYLSAMDMLIFPSLYEGFPIALLEAQASGLPGIVSDTVTPEACVTDLLRYLPLHDGSEKWAENVLAAKPRIVHDRGEYWLRVQKAGFDFAEISNVIDELYK